MCTGSRFAVGSRNWSKLTDQPNQCVFQFKVTSASISSLMTYLPQMLLGVNHGFLSNFNSFNTNHRPFTGKNQDDKMQQNAYDLRKVNCNWITSVHHQTWLQKANSAASPWMLMPLSAPPGQHHTSSWIVFVVVARQHQVSNSMDEPHQPARHQLQFMWPILV